MKKLIAILLTLALAVSMVACGSNTASTATTAVAPAGTTADAGEETTADSAKPGEGYKVALIASSSGLGDRSFNDAAWEGFNNAQDQLGVEIKVVEPKDVADYVSSASALAEAGYQLIFATGSDWADTITEVSALYPDVKFVGLNVAATGNNVAIARTADHQIGFLAGALAAMMTQTGTVGYIGGKENASQVRFNTAYVEGAKYVSDATNVLTAWAGAFNDPAKGKEYALELANQGADVIFHTAGQTGNGLFEAIQELDNVYAIGVDSNQDYIVEGKVLTTAEKHLQVIAYDMIERLINGTFTAGVNLYDLSNDGVGLTDMEFTKDLIGAERLAKLDEIKAGIIDGSIKVTDTFEQN